MQVMNATTFRQNLFQTLEQTVRYNEPIHITAKEGGGGAYECVRL